MNSQFIKHLVYSGLKKSIVSQTIVTFEDKKKKIAVIS